MKKQWIVLAMIVVITALAVHQSPTPKYNKEELPKVGFKAPQFSLTDLDGKEYSFDDLNGKPVIINFWASWCGPCRIEAPDLVKLYRQYKEQVEIYAVNVTIGDSIDGAKAFAKEYGFDFPVLLDPDGTVSRRYQISPIPTTFFVDGNGIIVDQVIGVIDPHDLESKFKQLIRRR